MSISFSGLASGLDTSSWVESLTALREAKVETYEEEKTSVESLQETLSNIKSFFSSFRSMIEKVTDASFGIPTMDIFAQKLATSTDTSVLTAAATTEAEEGTYDVFVDKLATETQAISGLNTTKTIIESQTATLDSSLKSIGVRAGEIGVTVNGTKHVLELAEDDTIQDLIKKLQNIGVSANYNETSGIFSVNLDSDDIDDTLTVQDDGTVGTGIVEALNLSETGGYESGDLEVSTVDTIVATATGETKLSTLGVKDGTVKIEANGVEYSFQITNNSTIEEFVDAMQGEGIEASFEDGVLSITDAEITDDGTTNLISALGLKTSVNHNTQTSDGLNYTEIRTAQLYDKITDFVPDGKGEISIFDKTGVKVGSVTVTDSTTFESLFDRLSDFGIKGRLEDGVVSISSTSGNYVTGGLMDKLGVGVVTTTITTTSGAGISSGSAVDYDTVTEETTTIYTTTTQTHTSTSTVGTGISSGSAVDYNTVVSELTTVYSTTTLTTTSTTAVDTTSSGVLTYSTVVTTSTTETIAVDMTSSSGVYYTKVVTTTSPGGGEESGGTEGYSSMQSSSAVYVTNKTSTSLGSDRVINPKITVTDAALLNDAIANYTTIGIGSAEALAQLATVVNSGNTLEGKTIVLTNDIDLSGYSSWNSIDGFYGIFDGQGHVIKNLKNSLFGCTLRAEIRNVGISCNITVNENGYVGGLIRVAGDTKISNSYVTGNISISDTTSGSYTSVGGLIGKVFSGGIEISNSYVAGTISATNSSARAYAGGLVGRAEYDVKISNSYVAGTISATDSPDNEAYAGGLVGCASDRVEISNSYVTGSISAAQTSGYGGAYAYAGGLIGYTSKSFHILSSYTSANVTSSSDRGVAGGLVGCDYDNYGTKTIQNVLVLGKSEGNLAGAILGRASSSSIIASGIYYNSSNNTVVYSGSSPDVLGATGVEGSMFTADYIEAIGFTDANGWMYTGSSALPELKVHNQLNSATTLKELLGDGCSAQTVVVQTSSGIQNIVISADDSILEKLTDAGLQVSAENGILSINGGGNATILSVSSALSDALKLVGTAEGDTSSEPQGTTKPVELTSGESVTLKNDVVTSSVTLHAGDTLIFNYAIKLRDIGVSTTNYITVQNGATITTIMVDGLTAISNTGNGTDLVQKLQEVGINTYITNGKVTFVGDETHYILGMTADLRIALNMDSGVGYTVIPNQTTGGDSGGSGSSGGSSTYISTIYISSSASNVALSSVGVNSTNYITVKNGSTTSIVTVDASTTVNQLSSALAGVGITTDVTNGKFTFSGDSTHYILGMTTNLKSALNLMESGGQGYTVRTVETSSTQTVTLASANTDIQLGALGVTGSNFITVQNGTTTRTISVDSNTSLSDMVSLLANAGIAASVSGGKLTLSGDDSHYILGITDNLESALKLTAGSGKTYTTSTIKTTVTTPVETTVNVTQNVLMSEETLFSQLGMTSNSETIVGVYNGRTFTMTVTSSDTVGDIANELEDYGFNTSVRGGKLYIDGSENAYLTGMSSNLKKALGITSNIGAGTTYTVTTQKTETTTTTVSEKTEYTTSSVLMSEETLFSQLGMSGNQTITGVQHGKAFTISVTASDTVGDILGALGDYGLTASVRGGKIYINQSDDAYITNMSSGIKSALNITSTIGNNGSYTITTIKTYENTAATNGVLGTVTATSAVTRDTLLSELGVTSGEFNIRVNGVKYTALISSDETVGDFLDTLETFGLQTSIINNGNSSVIRITGNGDAYIQKSSSVNGASNVVDVLFPAANSEKTYNYEELLQTYTTVTSFTTATEDTLLTEFDTAWGGTTLKTAGNLVITTPDGDVSTIRIRETDTIGSLIDKLETAGIAASFNNGKFYIYGGASIVAAGTTSSLGNPNAGLELNLKNNLVGMMFSTDKVEETTTIIEEHSFSAASYADLNTKLGTLNITGGTLSVYRNGQKILLNIEADDTFSDLRAMLASKYSDLDLKFEEGHLIFYSKDDDVSVEVGNTTDTSNFLAVTGLIKEDNQAKSARALYTVNSDSLVTADGIFRAGKVTTGSFTIGTAVININSNTTIADIVSQINNNEDTNATAYWDSIDGKLVIEARTSGAALINIEAGTSNFTDIMGFTSSEWNPDGTIKSTKMNIETQTLGSNAQFRINGTTYTASSNTVTSDITRLKGVTLNLNGLTAGSAVKVTVENDKESVATALSDIVDSYNELMKNVDEAIANDGALHNQTTLKMIRNQLRSLMTSSDRGATIFRNLDAIGISVDAASASNISTSNSSIISLTFDKEKFFDAYEAEHDAVKDLLIGGVDNKGIFTQVETLLENSLQAVSGYFAITEKSFQRQINNLNEKISKENTAIEKYRARLEKKFSSMDILIGQMQQQYSSFLGF